MNDGLLPLFPLEVVLLPGTILPLHIFEDRYREMINECLEHGAEFGVVLARGNGVLRTGCTAAIERVVERHEDGRLDILTIGSRRFEIEAIDTSRAFYQASVRFFGDDDPAPARQQALLDAARHHREFLKLTGEEVEPVDLESPGLSFIFASVSPDLNFRQTLLQSRSEADRMERVSEHLESLVGRQRAKDEMKGIAQKNGHTKHIPGLAE